VMVWWFEGAELCDVSGMIAMRWHWRKNSKFLPSFTELVVHTAGVWHFATSSSSHPCTIQYLMACKSTLGLWLSVDLN
jgi:hypothetical protein